MYTSAPAKLKIKLQSAEGLTFGHASWTNCNNESFVTVTARYITSSWELVICLTNTSRTHWRRNCTRTFEWQRELGITCPVVFLIDNTSADVKAVHNLEWPHITFYGHNNLAVKDGLKIDPLPEILGKWVSSIYFVLYINVCTTVLEPKAHLRFNITFTI